VKGGKNNVLRRQEIRMSMPRGIEIETRKMYPAAGGEMPWDKGETSLRPQKGQEKIAIL
jgi:hypothetical protein